MTVSREGIPISMWQGEGRNGAGGHKILTMLRRKGQRWARSSRQGWHRRGLLRHVELVHSPRRLLNQGTNDCQTDLLPSCLKLVLLNARFIRNKTSVNKDLIMDEEIHQACITET